MEQNEMNPARINLVALRFMIVVFNSQLRYLSSRRFLLKRNHSSKARRIRESGDQLIWIELSPPSLDFPDERFFEDIEEVRERNVQ